jgi:hypothetical protein
VPVPGRRPRRRRRCILPHYCGRSSTRKRTP